MENLFLKTRIALLESFILNNEDAKKRYLDLLNDLKQEIKKHSEGSDTEPLLNILEEHALNIQTLKV
ncbi:MAG: hypothetical protein K2Q03_06045 [Sphingobacteriaceae bacterium]|nr:hypothetical protein [Sphingobacteriaceae bacterium]